MKVFKDKFTNDEMFSDAYPIKLVDEVVYEVQGKYESRVEGDIQIAGANPSAEEVDEGTDTSTIAGIDVVLNHGLVECNAFGDKKAFLSYLKEYMKKLVKRMEDDGVSADHINKFKTKSQEYVKNTLLGKFKDLTFYTGESMDVDGMVGVMDYRDVKGNGNEDTPIFVFFKDGLEEEKY